MWNIITTTRQQLSQSVLPHNKLIVANCSSICLQPKYITSLQIKTNFTKQVSDHCSNNNNKQSAKLAILVRCSLLHRQSVRHTQLLTCSLFNHSSNKTANLLTINIHINLYVLNTIPATSVLSYGTCERTGTVTRMKQTKKLQSNKHKQTAMVQTTHGHIIWCKTVTH